jgi:hypothetical protein
MFRWYGEFSPCETWSKLVSITDIYQAICKLIGVESPSCSAQDSISFANYIYSGNHALGLRKWSGLGRTATEGSKRSLCKLKVVRHRLGNGKVEVEVFDQEQIITELTFRSRICVRRYKNGGGRYVPHERFEEQKSVFSQNYRNQSSKLIEFLGDNPTNCDAYNEVETSCSTACSSFERICSQF